MIEINLIPDVKKELIKANKTRNVVVTGSIFAGAVAVALVIILGLIIGGQVITSAAQDRTIKSESENLAKIEDLSKMLTIQNQLGTITSLNDGKPITSRVLGLLDVIHSSGVSNVEISNLNLDLATRTLEIEGQTQAGYPGVEAMVKTLNNAEVTYDVRQETESTQTQGTSEDSETTEEVSEVTAIALLSEEAKSGEVTYGRDTDGGETARFHLTLLLTEEFLDVKHENVRVRIKNGGNVTDSYLGIPKSIFAPAASDINNQEGN